VVVIAKYFETNMKFIFLLTIFNLLLSGCSSQYPNNDLVGQQWPSVKGKSLTDEQVSIPEDFAGKATLLLFGYKQDSQFDIDRWLIALDMTNTKIDVYEIPTIEGMFPRMFSTFIDNGMRSGIPKELWKGVITVYEDGKIVQKFTGNQQANNARVVLLNKSGEISFFYDRGFSVEALNAVRELIEST
jgi:hypothetical protein